MESLPYRCPKCSCGDCEVGELHAAGGFWSKIFDVQGAGFTTVTCAQCRYTELYKVSTSQLANVFDLFTN